jgi:hypothetical protein
LHLQLRCEIQNHRFEGKDNTKPVVPYLEPVPLSLSLPLPPRSLQIVYQPISLPSTSLIRCQLYEHLSYPRAVVRRRTSNTREDVCTAVTAEGCHVVSPVWAAPQGHVQIMSVMSLSQSCSVFGRPGVGCTVCSWITKCQRSGKVQMHWGRHFLAQYQAQASLPSLQFWDSLFSSPVTVGLLSWLDGVARKTFCGRGPFFSFSIKPQSLTKSYDLNYSTVRTEPCPSSQFPVVLPPHPVNMFNPAFAHNLTPSIRWDLGSIQEAPTAELMRREKIHFISGSFAAG